MKLSRKSRCRCCHNVIACTENGHESPVFIPRMHNMHTMHTYHTCHACAAKLSRSTDIKPEEVCLGRNLARERLSRRRTETQRYRETKRHSGTQSNLWHKCWLEQESLLQVAVGLSLHPWASFSHNGALICPPGFVPITVRFPGGIPRTPRRGGLLIGSLCHWCVKSELWEVRLVMSS